MFVCLLYFSFNLEMKFCCLELSNLSPTSQYKTRNFGQPNTKKQFLWQKTQLEFLGSRLGLESKKEQDVSEPSSNSYKKMNFSVTTIRIQYMETFLTWRLQYNFNMYSPTSQKSITLLCIDLILSRKKNQFINSWYWLLWSS